MKKIIGLLLLCMSFLLLSCIDESFTDCKRQEPDTRAATGNAFVINRQLGRGINIGDTFENGIYAGSWDSGYFRHIANYGFTHVRIPIHWETMVTPGTNTINPAFMQKMKSVVDEALRCNLYVIINMHHHTLLMNNPSQYIDRFLSQWRQIATTFQSYPDKLLFEILNEPGDAITPDLWNQGLTMVYPIIRESNPNRIVLIGTPYGGGISGLNRLQLPANDGKIIITVHYYNPFYFTHQGAAWVGEISNEWIGTQWRDTKAERISVDWDVKLIKAFSNRNNVPIHIGEFGAYEKADMESRIRWTTYVARTFEQYGFSWAYWELYSGFGIYDRRNGVIRQGLLDALTSNHIPSPTTLTTIPVYHSDFSSNQDGWYLLVNRNAGAEASLTYNRGKVSVNVSRAGTAPSHVQLVRIDTRNRIPTLVKGKQYMVTFKASSSPLNSAGGSYSNRYYQSYIGQNYSPWNAYSTVKAFAIGEEEEELGYIFPMQENTDNNCRLYFDLGAEPGVFTLCDFKLDVVEL